MIVRSATPFDCAAYLRGTPILSSEHISSVVGDVSAVGATSKMVLGVRNHAVRGLNAWMPNGQGRPVIVGPGGRRHTV